ncbi:MAG: protease inhibitor I42 family protein [Thermodesulfobacteriota bacterium]|nr:protease inhibitor I42 family protein [Thermodesulfobacteriota bacterium]
MTIRKIIVLVYSVLFLISFFTIELIYPKEHVSVILTKEDSGSVLEIVVGDFFVIELEGNPSTGFWWHFDNFDEKFLEVIRQETKKTSEKRLGAPVLGRWILKAKKCGETAIKMVYYRQWEGADEAVDRVSFTIRIR